MLVLSFTLSPAGAAVAAQRVLGDPADLPRRHGRRRRHRAHQLAGQSRRLRRPHRRRVAARRRRATTRPACSCWPRRWSSRRSWSRRCGCRDRAGRLARRNRATCLNMSASVITAATAIPMTTARLIQSIACVRSAGASGAGGGDDVGTTGLQQGADRRRAERRWRSAAAQCAGAAATARRLAAPQQTAQAIATGMKRGKQARTRCQEGRARTKQQERIRGHREPPGQDQHGDNQVDHELPDRHRVPMSGHRRQRARVPLVKHRLVPGLDVGTERRGRPWRR